MVRRKRKPVFIEYLRIEKYASEGKALGYHNGKIIFVSHSVPGDVVTAKIIKKKKNYLIAIAVKIHEYSPFRKDAFCSHFGVCGGCSWQNLPYDKQLEYKQQEVIDNLAKFGKIDISEVEPIIPSPSTKYYRNKLEFSFSHKRWLLTEEIEKKIDPPSALGFHVSRWFDKVVDIKHCYLQAEPSNTIRLAVKKYAMQHNLSFFNLKKKEGFLRNLIIRTSSTGETMVILSFFVEDISKREALLAYLSEKYPTVNSWMYVINPKGNATLYDLDILLYKGNDFIKEKIGEISHKIGPKSFFQTNTEQIQRLYKKILEYADLRGNEIVYDLYTGIGSIANFIAGNAKKVMGIESIPEAVAYAKENAEFNHIENTGFFVGEIENVLNKSFIEKNGKPDLIITDPPRAGMHKKVVETIKEINAPAIIYVSCNVATQARDINLLNGRYAVEKIQPIDMFPHTHHVENIALLKRK